MPPQWERRGRHRNWGWEKRQMRQWVGFAHQQYFPCVSIFLFSSIKYTSGAQLRHFKNRVKKKPKKKDLIYSSKIWAARMLQLISDICRVCFLLWHGGSISVKYWLGLTQGHMLSDSVLGGRVAFQLWKWCRLSVLWNPFFMATAQFMK